MCHLSSGLGTWHIQNVMSTHMCCLRAAAPAERTEETGDGVEAAALQALHDSRLACEFPPRRTKAGASRRWAHSLHPWVGAWSCGTRSAPGSGAGSWCCLSQGLSTFPAQRHALGRIVSCKTDLWIGSSFPSQPNTKEQQVLAINKMTTVSLRWAGPVYCAHAIPEALQEGSSPPPPPQGYPQAASMAPRCTFALEE